MAPVLGFGTGFMVGGFLFLACALLHEVLARRESEELFMRRLAALRRASIDIQQELSKARDEARRIYEVLEGATAGSPDDRRQIDDVVAEVKVLQSLVEQLYPDGTSELPSAAVGEPPAKAGEGDEREWPEPRIAHGLDDREVLNFMRAALSRDRVELYLQPIVSLPQRKRRYFECYSRLRAEDGTIIVPEQYLEIAKAEGHITAIDNMLLFRCVQLIRRTQKHKFNLGFFCNISHHSIEDEEFFRSFVAFMEDNPELAPNLFFEFAHADVEAHDEAALRHLDRLADLGFRFSVDQVGDLDLNVTALARRHFGYVKLKAELLLRKSRQDPPEVDVRDFKALLDQAGIDLVVEKIENEGDLIELLDYNIDYGQGFLFGEPRPARES